MTGNGFAPTILTQSPLGNKAGALAFAPAGLRDALQDLDEIKEALVQITVYCGTPAGRQAFLAAHEALKSPKD
jgi:alkylhydroperoxidase/carboxymuconolactone decarboxylase family protein YurZ